MADSMERYARVPSGGYTSVDDVTKVPPGQHRDHQESFLLAETFKYLYLLFTPGDVINLDKWVLNTEAHPLRIFPEIHENGQASKLEAPLASIA